MKITDLLTESINRNTTYYHGTNSNFDAFDLGAERANRGTNITGIYFTPRPHEAETFGSRIISANLDVRRPFYNNKRNNIDSKMAATTKALMLRFTRYKDDWLDSVIIPEFIKDGSMRMIRDLNGDVKREILLAGGYDSYIDGDHVVVLLPSKS